MGEVKNWVREDASAPGTGTVNLDLGAAGDSFATFLQAFGNQDTVVEYSIEDDSGNMETGEGTFRFATTTLERTSVRATFTGDVYDDSSPAAVNFTNQVVVSCALSAEAFSLGAGGATVSETRIPAVGGQGTYSFTHTSFDVLQVFYNGDLLVKGIDYTTDDSANTITLLLTEITGDDILVIRFGDQIGSPDLSAAVFPDYASFEPPVAGDATIDFSDGNNQEVDAATYPSLTLTGISGKLSHYTLTILNSGSLVGITPAIHWGDSSAPNWSGRSVLSLYDDGTTLTGSAVTNTGTV